MDGSLGKDTFIVRLSHRAAGIVLFVGSRPKAVSTAGALSIPPHKRQVGRGRLDGTVRRTSDDMLL